MPPGTQRVPFEGPDEYNIMCVGEAPGGEEQGQGRPFVGPAGQLLEKYLERNEVERHKVKLCNLSKFRPSKNSNDFKLLLGTPQLEEGIEELEEEIKRAKPNVVIALGGWPLYFLTGMMGKVNKKPTPGSGVFSYRGSRLPALPKFGENQKVFCTFHPSYVRRVWKWNPIFNLDIIHAIEDSEFPELRYPEYDKYVDPAPDIMIDLVHEAISSDWISLDIENFKGGKYSCVGWSWKNRDRYKAVCQTYKRQDLHKYSKEVWESDTPKIAQYGTHDFPFMERFYGWRAGGYYGGKGWDTFIAAGSIAPDFPRNLGFLISQSTRFPYYKDERTESKEQDDMSILWDYNMKDTVGTYQVAEDQMKDIKEMFG